MTYYRQDSKRVEKRLSASVKADRLHFEHLLQPLTLHNVPIEIRFKRFNFSIHKAA